MRWVLDTNVVVSALLWGGKPYLLLQKAVDGEVELFTSPSLVAELGDILVRRPHLTRKLADMGLTVSSVTSLYLNFAQVVTPLLVARVVPNDSDDDHVVACALSAIADAIVSGDRHLLDLHEHQGISMITVAEAVKRIMTP